MSDNKYDYQYVINPRDLIQLHVATEMLISKLDQQIKELELNPNSFPCKYKIELQELLDSTHYANLKRINATDVK